jgi:hypothetical protein
VACIHAARRSQCRFSGARAAADDTFLARTRWQVSDVTMPARGATVVVAEAGRTLRVALAVVPEEGMTPASGGASGAAAGGRVEALWVSEHRQLRPTS